MILNGLRAALAIFSGKIILNFVVQNRLRAVLNHFFTEKGHNKKRLLL